MQLAYEDYTIGWIAALPHELAPARALLDEEHEALEGPPGDTNTYTLGRMGKHNVVIAALPIGVTGTNAAAKAAKDLIRTFQNIRFGLMVGVGGGVPTGPEDVRLGDIVVSTQQGRSGGVLQYDFGTELQCDTSGNLEQDDFEIKSFLREPHTSLQTAVSNLKSKSLVDGYEYLDIYEDMLIRKPKMKQNFTKPTTDILFSSEYVHQAGAENNCSACDPAQVIDRPLRNESIVHYGLIGSGNQVIRNAVLRDKLYRKEKIICFEMEAAGLMKDFECMVIRGVCDYCDSHKNKDWQPYAAAVTAAYAKELLLVLPVQQVKAMPRSTILNAINDDLRNIAAQTTKIITDQQYSELRKALEWIAAPDPETNFRDAKKRKDPETGMWIAESPVYMQWKTGLKRHLWLYGKAGCGKSVLTATAIPDIRQYCGTTEGAAFAMFYFTFTDIRKQAWQDCLKSLVVQLVDQEPAVSILIQAHQASKGSSPNEEFLRRLLLSAIKSHQQVFIAIDALDESPPDVDGDGTVRSIVLDNLAWLSMDASHVKFFLTSRNEADIRESMETMEVSSVPMAAECVNRDIMKYVANQLITDKKLSRLNNETKDKIKTTLTAKADGMFRWAFCQLHELKKLKFMRPKDIERALTALPTTLDETYERMLRGIDPSLQKEVLTLLRWLAYAQRPFSLRELAETITIDLDQEDGIVDANNRSQPEQIANLLAGLIVIKSSFQRRFHDDYDDYSDDNDDYGNDDDDDDHDHDHDPDGVFTYTQGDLEQYSIQLAHFSVKEYLESPRSVSSPFHLVFDHGQHFLLNCCLAYLMSYAENKERLGTKKDFTAFPLVRYAAKSWFKHYVDTADVQYVVSFLTSEKALEAWTLVYDAYDYSQQNDLSLGYPRGTLHGLYFASIFGLYTVAKKLIELGADVNASRGVSKSTAEGEPTGETESALAAACQADHEKLVELLIKAGANVNEEDNLDPCHDHNPLFYSSRNGNLQIILMLMKSGVNRNAQNISYRKCINIAAEHGQEEALRYLIDSAEDLDVQRGDLCESLGAAICYHHSHLVKILIEDYGVDPKMRNEYYIYGSVSKDEHGRRVRLPYRTYYYYNNSLFTAVSTAGNQRIIKMLIEDYGVDVHLKLEENDATVLQAAMHPFFDTPDPRNVQILLDAGADPKIQGGRYGNALQAAIAAAGWPHSPGDERVTEVVKMLIAAGAEVNAQGGYYGNALQAAVYNGNTVIVKLLLETGAKANAQGGYYGNALQAATAAAAWPHSPGDERVTEVVKMLIAAGAEVNAQGGYYGSALQAAANNDAIEIVKLLLELGAEVNAQGGYYGNALSAAASSSKNGQLVKTLLDAGAGVNAQDLYGISTLMFAASYGCLETVKMLIERGADVNMLDCTGRSAVHFAAKQANIVAYQQLLATKICNLDLQDRLEKTILDYVCISGSAEMLKAFWEMGQPKSSENILSSRWSPWHWACRTGTFEVLEMLNKAGIHTWVVETNLPAAKWTPLDVAIYYKNEKLATTDGYRLKHYWHSLCQSGTVLDPTSGHSEVIQCRENSLAPANEHHSYFCDGCLKMICGIHFRCQIQKDLDYCFMCKHALELIHPDYAWDYKENEDEEWRTQ